MASQHLTLSGQQILNTIETEMRKDFETTKRVLAFDEYLVLLAESPLQQLRGSAKYMADMIDSFGKSNSAGQERFRLFDLPVDGLTHRIVGQETVQNQIYRILRTFTRQKINNRLILLNGPNGSSKTSMIRALMKGMELYSQQSVGAIYTFSWAFPHERSTKSGIGISPRSKDPEQMRNYAKLPDDDIAARIPCELRDHPVLLVPPEKRKAFLARLIGEKPAQDLWESLPTYLSMGDLCHRCKLIFDALLKANGGDFNKILSHVQVERFYFSQRYRRGLVTIEPQLHVDANYQQLTYNKMVANLPVSLQSLNLFTLSGDLIDGNRGLIEYSDLLKRPIDSYKYLLHACETGSINVASSIAHLDTVMLGSTNEIQLDAFKEFPDFMSFKARLELVRVPYLLSVSEEIQIYEPLLDQIRIDKHIAPHAAWTAALWAILTRLKRPNAVNYPPQVGSMISGLTPLQKARLYDAGEIPPSLSADDRKLLRANLKRLREEYWNIPYYEGRVGASAREMKSLLSEASQNSEFPCLSPLAVLKQLEEIIKHSSEHEFLRQEVKDGYHDAQEFIQVVRNEYLNIIDQEVRDSIGLYNSSQWGEFLKRYVQHISLVLKKEKTKNPITGSLEDPDHALIQEFEKIVEAPSEGAEKDAFRQNIISQVGAWSLDHPGEPVHYSKVFPDFWKKLEKHYYESQKSLLTKMSEALLVYGTDQDDQSSEGTQLARRTIQTMRTNQGYCEKCAKEVIRFLMRQRY